LDVTAGVFARLVTAGEPAREVPATAGEPARKMPAIAREAARKTARPSRTFVANLVAIVLFIGVAEVAGPPPHRRRQLMAARSEISYLGTARSGESLGTQAFKIDQAREQR